MSPEQKLALSRTKLQSLKELAQRKNLSADLKKKLPGLIEMQAGVIRMLEKSRQRQALLRLSRLHETSNRSAMH